MDDIPIEVIQFEIEEARSFLESDERNSSHNEHLKSSVNIQLEFLINRLDIAKSLTEAQNTQQHFREVAEREFADMNIARNLAEPRLPPMTREQAIENFNPVQNSAAEGKVDTETVSDEEVPDAEIAGESPSEESIDLSVEKSTSESSKGVKCSACLSFHHASKTTCLPCEHKYCRSCITQLCRSALTDKSLVPVRCCSTVIEMSTIQLFLSQSEFLKYEHYVAEVTATNKMYCSNSSCSQFIDLDKLDKSSINSDGSFECVNKACRTILCYNCKISHRGLTCEQYRSRKSDTEDAAFMELVKSKKYQKCNNCKMFLELIYGCNHITCTCRNSFCFQCGLKWKTCGCKNWEEENIILEAENRRIEARRNNLNLRMGNIVDRIRNERHCEGDHAWARVPRGRMNCRNCGFFMPVYHFGCERCNFMVCYTCRFHRLV